MKSPQKECENIAPLEREDTHHGPENHRKSGPGSPADSSRRSFMGKVGMGSAAAVALAAVPLEPLIEDKHGDAEASVVDYRSNNRANDSWNYRKSTAQNEKIDVGELPDNGDLHRFTDYSGNWSKCLKHDALGDSKSCRVPQPASCSANRRTSTISKTSLWVTRGDRDSLQP